jgi:predicted permease
MVLGFVTNLRRSGEQRAFAVLNIPGYNIGNFTMPFVQSFLGAMGVITTSLFDVGNAFVCLGGSFGVARAIKEGGKMNLLRILKAPFASIPFLTHLLMVSLNLLHLNVPGPIVSFCSIVGNANPAMAMLMIGVGFNLSGETSQKTTVVKILSARYAIALTLAAVFYFCLPFDLQVRQALALLAVSPIGTAVPVFTAELKEDAGLSSAINSIAIVISIVLMVSMLLIML